ncbi:hypothetical protein HYFRA_00010091 [Hymenoscyphus fraxineus]|uniref:Ent-kaurene synthase n=1 Tax=Hymenoscyphus fraxineus TaxID=746836 RepID=A0A9N9PTL6_9HELO|nr:hypothetical protein HYFRA_00010091 [Hymenoscyphus fraxineus]
MNSATLEVRVDKLLRGMLNDYDSAYGFGSMSSSVYDTAWVACIKKAVSGSTQWLFPSSYNYILDSQLSNGGWPAHPNSTDTDEVDGILSTMAAILCLKQHFQTPLQLRHYGNQSLIEKIAAGEHRLSILLNEWDVGKCNSVGYEVLVPSLLELLEYEDLYLEFPGKEKLLEIRDKKLTKLRPEVLYQGKHFALLHSLEAFHQWSEFNVDKISHHKIGGSIMASPSATASYLMRSSTWDDEAEAYLRLVMSNGHGKNTGGVPSAYPSTNFELIWVASTLLEANLLPHDQTTDYNQALLNILEISRQCSEGLVGFAPGIEPDLDDSSKASIIFSALGKPGFTASIVEHFDSPECLKTYQEERNPSLSANCNALLAILLDSTTYPSKQVTIEKLVKYICLKSQQSDSLEDKWNLSPYYSAMLMSQALTEYLRAFAKGKILQCQTTSIQQSVMITLFHCLVQTLNSQKLDGNWGDKGPMEETSYAILTLVRLLVLPHAQFLRPQILSAIDRGRSFLLGSKTNAPEHLWIEKVSYSSANLAEVYAVAALYIAIDGPSLGQPVSEICKLNNGELAKLGVLIGQGPLSKSPRWIVLASWIESRLYSLEKQWTSTEKDCFEPVAFSWFLANNKKNSACSLSFTHNMIDLSTRINQVTMLRLEDLASQNDNRKERLLKQMHHFVQIFSQPELPLKGFQEIQKPALNGLQDGLKRFPLMIITNGKTSYGNLPTAYSPAATKVFSSFADFFSKQDAISNASGSLKEVLGLEAKQFLTAQTIQLESAISKSYRSCLSCPSNAERSSINPPTGLTGIPLLFSLATCLQDRKNGRRPPSEFQNLLLKDIRDRAESCFLMKQQFHHSASVACRHQAEMSIDYQQSLLTQALKQIQRSKESQPLLDGIVMVLEYVEIRSVETIATHVEVQ